MGRKVLLAAACWLALANTWADAKKASTKLEDSVGEATVSRLYRNVPVGVYASAAPYAAFSFHVPTFASSSRINQLGPIKQESVVIENTHGFLKDSYGNKFVGSPQTLSYRTPFPQQYLQLQELPAHLAQPLVSAAPNFQYKQATPHFFGPAFKLQAFQASLPSTANRYAINQPHAFSGSIKSLVPIQQQQQQQHPTSNQATFANTHDAEQFQNLKNVGKLQRFQELPSDHKIDNEHRVNNDHNVPNEHKENQAGHSPQVTQNEKVQHKAVATAASSNKGKKAVINIVTKPPVPLLDLTLLEPLTFANPLVPQVQHFLPRISSVTYHKLPQANVNEIKKEMKQFIIQNTKSYDSGLVKGKPKNNLPKKTESKPQAEDEEAYHEQAPPEPTGAPEDVSNEEPEIVYEINSPNYKETYKEKVVSYNKETQSEPVTYNYAQKTEKEPVHYNYVHSSKEPLQVKNIHYENDGQNPKQLVYTFTPEDKNENHHQDHSPQPQKSSHESSEQNVPQHHGHKSSGRPYEKDPAHNQYHEKHEHHQHHSEKPEHHHQHEKSQYHHEIPKQHHHENPQHYNHHESPKQHHHKNPQHHHPHESPKQHHHENHQQYHRHESPKQYHHENHQHHQRHESPKQYHHENPQHHRNHENPQYHHQHQERPEHREGEYHHSSGEVIPKHIHHNSPKEYSQINNAPVANSKGHFHPIITEYEEDIRILPSPQPYAPIKVNPNQHIQHGQEPSQPNTRDPHRRPHDPPHNRPDSPSRPHNNPELNVHDQSKRIQEEAPETQNTEQLNEEDPEQDEDSEENFEKSYKNAAFGFPAYESRDAEKEIYDAEQYGQPRYHTDFDIEHSPFQQYQVNGDEFPKSTRSNYKDARDKTKEEYYLDYAISKPESLLARYKQKEDYYNVFMKQKPHYLFNEREDDKKNQKQSEKYIVAPAFQHHGSTQKPKQYFANYKEAPVAHVFEYDYSKKVPKDNSAHSTRPHQRYKTHTQFVEPQFQYGFEPSALPLLLDSELAAMASNNSPEMRKKIFKENWYIKKTIMNGRQVDS